MIRTAQAHWTGSGRDGEGRLTAPSGVLRDTPYSFHTRFEDQPGTNPEELIAAAHAGCFNMALAFQLAGAGLTPEALDTTARVTLEKQNGDFGITRVHLELRARVPGAGEAQFQALASTAKANCPVSRVLNAEITLDARLEG